MVVHYRTSRDGEMDHTVEVAPPTPNLLAPKALVPTNRHDGAQSQHARTLAFATGTTEIIALFRKKDYKIGVTLGERASSMVPMSEIMDPGAGPSLTRQRSVAYLWQSAVKTVRDPVLTAATKKTVEVQGVILLHLQVGDLCVRI